MVMVPEVVDGFFFLKFSWEKKMGVIFTIAYTNN